MPSDAKIAELSANLPATAAKIRRWFTNNSRRQRMAALRKARQLKHAVREQVSDTGAGKGMHLFNHQHVHAPLTHTLKAISGVALARLNPGPKFVRLPYRHVQHRRTAWMKRLGMQWRQLRK